MLDTFLVPPKTVVTASGDGPTINISSAETRVFLLLLDISGTVEQEALEVSVSGEDSALAKGHLASFPQVFYTGQYPLLLDLSALPAVNSLRAHWNVSRWGRGSELPWFEIGLKLTEVPREILREREKH